MRNIFYVKLSKEYVWTTLNSRFIKKKGEIICVALTESVDPIFELVDSNNSYKPIGYTLLGDHYRFEWVKTEAKYNRNKKIKKILK